MKERFSLSPPTSILGLTNGRSFPPPSLTLPMRDRVSFLPSYFLPRLFLCTLLSAQSNLFGYSLKHVIEPFSCLGLLACPSWIPLNCRIVALFGLNFSPSGECSKKLIGIRLGGVVGSSSLCILPFKTGLMTILQCVLVPIPCSCFWPLKILGAREEFCTRSPQWIGASQHFKISVKW